MRIIPPRGDTRAYLAEAKMEQRKTGGGRARKSAQTADRRRRSAENGNRNGRHAARQLTDGTWTSKLGREIDITHTLPGLEGGEYGRIAMYMRRPQRVQS
jgi:hypothetical protein